MNKTTLLLLIGITAFSAALCLAQTSPDRSRVNYSNTPSNKAASAVTKPAPVEITLDDLANTRFPSAIASPVDMVTAGSFGNSDSTRSRFSDLLYLSLDPIFISLEKNQDLIIHINNASRSNHHFGDSMSPLFDMMNETASIDYHSTEDWNGWGNYAVGSKPIGLVDDDVDNHCVTSRVFNKHPGKNIIDCVYAYKGAEYAGNYQQIIITCK